MKKIALCLIFTLIFIGNGKAQLIFTPNTYYLTPPTSGCNGVWAVELPILPCNIISYTMSPLNCLTFGPQSGDTMFFNLCSIPCGFWAVNDSGNACLTCSVDFFNDIESPDSHSNNISFFPNPAVDHVSIKGEFPDNSQLIISNSIGQEVIRVENLSASSHEDISILELAEGIYFWQINSARSKHWEGRLTIIRP